MKYIITQEQLDFLLTAGFDEFKGLVAGLRPLQPMTDAELCKLEEPYLYNSRIPLGGQYDLARAVEKHHFGE